MGEAADFPYSLLGLGDVAIPGLLACLALRYDASRSTDMLARAVAAAAAIKDTVAGFDPDASSRQVAQAAAEAASVAYDRVADREQQQRDGMVSSSSGSSSNSSSDGASTSGGAAEEQRVKVSEAVLYQRPYFTPVLWTYVGGLAMAFAANSITHLGQPALLYLVPCTLTSVAATAVSRGEFDRVWQFTDVPTFGVPEMPKDDEKQ
jgi:minor histocompatibility antigen H13